MNDPLTGTWMDVRELLATAPAKPGKRGNKPEPLSGGERALLAVCVLLGGGVSLLGLLSSYTALAAMASRVWGWSWPWLLPVGVDLAIPAFTIAALLLIRVDMPLPWVRWVPRALTAATVYLNWSAGHALAGKIGHAVLIGLWVVFSEIAAHVYAVRIGAITGRRMEKIRRSRWVLAPLSTAALWRRMVLWEVTSYNEALTLERERLLARAALRERYGSIGGAPERVRVLWRLGALSPAAVDAHDGAQDERAPELEGERVPVLQDERPHDAQDERPTDAQPTPTQDAQDEGVVSAPGERRELAQPKPRKSVPKTLTDRRRKRARRVYDELGRRPEWTEIRDALVHSRLAPKSISRATVQRIRDRIEADEPHLAIPGTSNVRTLTGGSA